MPHKTSLDHFHLSFLTLENLSAAVDIHEKCFEKPWSAQSFQELFFLETTRGFSVFEGEQLIAFALLTVVDEEAEVLTFCVSPSRQSQGIGYFLMKEILLLLKYYGCNRCFLDVDEKNISAIKLYKKLGFIICGERKNYYVGKFGNKSNSLIMNLEI